MAIWQFNINFIPRQSLVEKYGHLPEQLNIDEEINWWLNLDIGLKTLLPLLQQFGNIVEWTEKTEGLRSFGDTETNDITVCFDNKTDKVEELSCRIDLRQIDAHFINKTLSLAKSFDCLLMDSQGRLFPPKNNALSDIIQLSNAKTFVSDPRQFLDDLSKGLIKPE